MRHRIIYSAALLAGLVSLGWSGPERNAAWVDQRIEQWQPTAREKRWEGIGWAGSLQEALRLAKTHQRPVFLFTHDGRLNIGRC